MGEKPTEVDEREAQTAEQERVANYHLADSEPGGIAVSDPGAPGEKSNTKREAGGGSKPAGIEMFREAGPGGGEADEEAVGRVSGLTGSTTGTIREAGPGGGEAGEPPGIAVSDPGAPGEPKSKK